MHSKRIMVFLCGVMLMGIGTLSAQMELRVLHFYFPTGKFDLSAAAKLRLDSLSESLVQHQRYEIVVRGHADSQGDSLVNQLLSERRATSVATHLTDKGMRIRNVRSIGQREPLVAGNTKEVLAFNRRVDVQVSYLPKAKPVPEVPKQPALVEIEDLTTIEDLLRQLRKPDQLYCINPMRDTILVCAQGAVLHFKAGSFKQATTCGDACVTIRVREDYEKSEQVLDHLNTMSNGQLLKSSGMIYTVAEDCKGKPIGLQPGKEMVAFIPADTVLTSDQLFYGHRQGRDSIMNWNGAIPVVKVSQTSLKDIWCMASLRGKGRTCPFFWCQIRVFLRMPASTRNQGKRRNQKLNGCDNLNLLCQLHGIQNPEALRNGLYAQFVKQNGYKSLEEMFLKEDPARLDSMVANYHNVEMQNPELKYNYYSTPQMGWNNIDKYMKYPANRVTKVVVDLKPDSHTICEMVFLSDHIIAEAQAVGDRYVFKTLPKQAPAVLLVIHYFGGKAYLAMVETKIEAGPYKVELKEVSLDELKLALEKLDY